MAEQQVWLGSVGPFLYDDASFFALRTTGKQRVDTAPSAANEVARQQEITDHSGAADPHTIYLKEKASGGVAAELPEHTHASAAQAGTVSHADLTNLTVGDPHTQYQQENEKDTNNGYAGYVEDTFTITGTGFDVNPTATARWVKVGGKQVTLYIPELSGTSNATSFTLTGIPAAINPTRSSYHVGRLVDNGGELVGLIALGETANVINLYSTMGGGSWTASGTKIFRATMLTYALV